VKAYVQEMQNSWNADPTSTDLLEPQSQHTGRTQNNGSGPPLLTDRDLNQLTFGLAAALASRHPTFAADGLSLTAWEARVDRGISMLIRPPSRLFGEAGLPRSVARNLPIRLDPGERMMGGGYIPARLIPQAEELLDRNLPRSVRRMIDGELDAVSLQGLMMEATAYARMNHMGLYEVIGLVDYQNSSTWPPDYRVRNRPADRATIQRISIASKPEPKPGAISTLWKRISGRTPNRLAP